jgi:membrane protease YdiL (CAAX protease family)
VNGEKEHKNSWLAWCIVAIFAAYFLAFLICFLIGQNMSPNLGRTLLLSLIPPVFLVSGLLLTTGVIGNYRELLRLCRFSNWKFFYLIEVIGLEIIFLAFAITFSIALLLIKEVLPEFFKILEMYSNSPHSYIKDMRWGSFYVLAIGAVIVAPVVEEIIFRVVMFNGIRKYTNQLYAIIITSMVFSVFHMNFIQFIPLFVLGLFFQFLYIYHKSIYPAIIFHSLHNGVAMTLLFFIKGIIGSLLFDK